MIATILTKVLLDAIDKGLAERNKNGRITDYLDAYLSEEVTKLTGEKQTPVIYHSPIPNFELFAAPHSEDDRGAANP